MYCIQDSQCEPDHQHQNPAERKIQDVKRMSDSMMDRTGTPAKWWLVCVLNTIFLLNHLGAENLGWLAPLTACFGIPTDVSALLAFHWWQLVYFADNGLLVLRQSKAML